MKKKVHKLVAAPETNCTYIAIASHEKDYFLCWKLNSNLKIELKKHPDFEYIKPKDENTKHFSVFDYNDEKHSLNYKLISNRSEQGFLIEELKNIDYFFRISGSISKAGITDIISRIRQTETVITGFEIDNQKFKIKQILH